MTNHGRRKQPFDLTAPYMGSARVNRRGWVKRSQRYFCLGSEPLVHRPCLTGIRVPGLGWSGFKSMSSLGLSLQVMSTHAAPRLQPLPISRKQCEPDEWPFISGPFGTCAMVKPLPSPQTWVDLLQACLANTRPTRAEAQRGT
jgi:hypothetical protein